MKYLFLIICLFLSGVPSLSNDIELIVPSTTHPTLQSAVDAIPEKGSITLLTGYYDDQQVLIQDKQITIIGQGNDFFGPTIEQSRFTPYIIKATGRAQLTLRNIELIGGSKAILLEPAGGRYPSFDFEAVTVRRSVRAVMATVDSGRIHRSRFQQQEGNGVIIKNAKALEISNSSFSGGINYGLVLQDLAESEVRITSVSASQNQQGGVWLHNVKGQIDIQNLNAEYNDDFNIRITNSSYVTVLDSRGVGIEYPVFHFISDGIQIARSQVTLGRFTARENERYGIAILGCDDDGDRTVVDVLSSSALMNKELNWASGLTQDCQVPSRWNWFRPERPADQISSMGFEDDSSGNICVNPTQEPVVCEAQRQDNSFSHSSPGF